MATGVGLRRAGFAALLTGAGVLSWPPAQALAWGYDCQPESARLCRSSGSCEATTLYGNGFRFADGVIQICNLGRCSRESQLRVDITPDAISASSAAMILSVQRKSGEYVRHYTTAGGTLMEQGRCAGG